MSDLAIIIPAYKDDFLRETLASIAAQSDKRFHLYIGDDCSPYDLKSIVAEFEDQIPITYRRFDTNLGGKDLVAQWERCIALSQSEKYIWLFSDDDVMDPDCVAAFYNVPDSIRNSCLIHFDINVIDGNSKLISSPLPYPEFMSAEEYLQGKLSGKLISYVVEFIFPREIYNIVSGFENFDLAWGSDFMTWLKMAVAGDGIYSLNCDNSKDKKCKINWRSSDRNISPDKSHDVMNRKLASLIENAAFIKKTVTENPKKFKNVRYSFNYAKFPIGEIKRNLSVFTHKDISKLIKLYQHKVGFITKSTLAYIYLQLSKLLSAR